MKHRLLLLFRIVLLRFSWLTASFSLFVNRLRVQCNLMQPITFVVPVISLKYLTDAVFIIDLVPEVTCRKQRWKTKKSRRLRVWLIMFQVLLFSGYKELPILVWPPAPTENTAKRVSTTVTSLSNQSLLQSIFISIHTVYIYNFFCFISIWHIYIRKFAIHSKRLYCWICQKSSRSLMELSKNSSINKTHAGTPKPPSSTKNNNIHVVRSYSNQE